LPRVRCPRCGAINDTRGPGYPFCAGCEDNLAKCGYCRWLDEKAVICLHPLVAGVFEVSKEATPPCAHHAPKESILLPRRGGRVLLWVALAAAVFVLAYGLARMLWPTGAGTPVAAVPELELAVEADYRGAVVGEAYRVMALLYNASDVVAENVRFEVAKESFKALYLKEVRPQPSARGESGRWQVFSYPPLNPRERRSIALELVPREPGTFHLVVRLLSDEQNYHGMADLPITVAKPESHTEAGEKRGKSHEAR